MGKGAIIFLGACVLISTSKAAPEDPCDPAVFARLVNERLMLGEVSNREALLGPEKMVTLSFEDGSSAKGWLKEGRKGKTDFIPEGSFTESDGIPVHVVEAFKGAVPPKRFYVAGKLVTGVEAEKARNIGSIPRKALALEDTFGPLDPIGSIPKGSRVELSSNAYGGRKVIGFLEGIDSEGDLAIIVNGKLIPFRRNELLEGKILGFPLGKLKRGETFSRFDDLNRIAIGSRLILTSTRANAREGTLLEILPSGDLSIEIAGPGLREKKTYLYYRSALSSGLVVSVPTEKTNASEPEYSQSTKDAHEKTLTHNKGILKRELIRAADAEGFVMRNAHEPRDVGQTVIVSIDPLTGRILKIGGNGIPPVGGVAIEVDLYRFSNNYKINFPTRPAERGDTPISARARELIEKSIEDFFENQRRLQSEEWAQDPWIPFQISPKIETPDWFKKAKQDEKIPPFEIIKRNKVTLNRLLDEAIKHEIKGKNESASDHSIFLGINPSNGEILVVGEGELPEYVAGFVLKFQLPVLSINEAYSLEELKDPSGRNLYQYTLGEEEDTVVRTSLNEFFKERYETRRRGH